jgi:hypothetical protein
LRQLLGRLVSSWDYSVLFESITNPSVPCTAVLKADERMASSETLSPFARNGFALVIAMEVRSEKFEMRNQDCSNDCPLGLDLREQK